MALQRVVMISETSGNCCEYAPNAYQTVNPGER